MLSGRQAIGRNSRFEGLEGLRGLMALWVVAGHVGNYMGYALGVNAPYWIKFFLLTNVPVNIFITLSGFVIFQMLYSRPDQTYRSYFMNRARRILPIYAVAFLLSLFLMDFRYDVYQMSPWRSHEQLMQFGTQFDLLRSQLPWHVAAHALLLHGIVPETVLANPTESILAPAWSLSLEWQFYLLAPLLFFVVTRSRYGLLLLIGGLLAIRLLMGTQMEMFTQAFLLISWPYFALGWWSSNFLSHQKRARQSGDFLFLGSSFAVITGATFWFAPDPRSAAVSMALWGMVFLAVSRQCAKSGFFCFVNKLLTWKGLMAVGKRSYSLYLLHVLVIDAVAYVLIKLGWLEVSSARSFLILLIFTVPIALLISWITYAQIESRFMRRSGKTQLQCKP